MRRTGLSHIALKSRDLKKTEEFYVGVLGCRVAFRHPPDMIFLTTPGSGDLLNFVKSAARISGSQGLEHIGFRMTAAELKKRKKTLKQHGVKIAGRRGRSRISPVRVFREWSRKTPADPAYRCRNPHAFAMLAMPSSLR